MTCASDSCLICDRVALWQRGQNPYFIHEFEHSIFVVGDHQFHQGYSLVLLKEHQRELHKLSPTIQTELFQEVMAATRAIVHTFHPWKMNHACYGNSEPHVHWHLFPRYSHDRDRHKNPWQHCAEFNKWRIDAQTARELSQRIQANLEEGGRW